ncbi:MAG: sterol desaturase family protein [Thermoanaerobaculia bacterium]
MDANLPGWVSPAIIAAGFLLLLFAELRWPLRREVESKPRRVARNLAAAGFAFAALTLLQTPILIPVSRWAIQHRIGLLNLLGLDGPVRVVLGALLLDYTLWHWHWINHKVPFFWRFHLVHHVDLDLDASTALRFHFGEFILSIGYRLLQVVAIGADPLSVTLWQTLLVASILFHHSNLRIPIEMERRLVRLIVTPRMHGIHHSTYANETNSNWSSLLSVWDYLHRTAQLNVPQDSIVIGVPAYQEKQDVTLGKVLTLPFERQRDDWAGLGGAPRERPHDPQDRNELSA